MSEKLIFCFYETFAKLNWYTNGSALCKPRQVHLRESVKLVEELAMRTHAHRQEHRNSVNAKEDIRASDLQIHTAQVHTVC